MSELKNIIRSEYVKIFAVDDGGKSHVHLMASGYDTTICGFDAVCCDIFDSSVHLKAPVAMSHKNHRVTCPQCLTIIACVRDHIDEIARGAA